MEYEFYTVTKESNCVHVGEKRVKIKIPNVDTILDFCIDIDKNGKEFFHVPNAKNHPEDGIFNTLFIDRIKDAIETIRDGDGDCILTNSTFNGTDTSVVKFLDEEYGNDLRQKSIEGFKDVKFGYGIKVGYTDSMFPGALIRKNSTMQSFGERRVPIKTFDTEEEANVYIKSFEKSAAKYAKFFCVLGKTDWMNNIITKFMMDNIMNAVEEDDILFKSFENACHEIDNNCAKAYIEVVQVIK